MFENLRNNWFFWYFIITGILMLFWFSVDINCGDKKEKMREIMADTTWDTGLSGEWLLCIISGAMLLFGWVFLPYKIFHKTCVLLGIIEEEE